jgi:hypothetical protein
MRRATPLLAVLSIFALGAGQSWAEDASSAVALPIPTNAVGRFYVNGKFQCTAWAVGSVKRTYRSSRGGGGTVYETRIVTAGHCVTVGIGDEAEFAWEQPAQNVQYGDTTIRMIALRSRAVLTAYSGPYYRGYDLAVLITWSPWPIASLVPDFDYRPTIGDRLLLMGYGQGAFLPRVGTFEGWEERTGALVVSGITSLGTSGGPVLIPGTNRVVGVAVRHSISPEDAALGMCAFRPCAPYSPWMAAPISALQGLLRWP